MRALSFIVIAVLAACSPAPAPAPRTAPALDLHLREHAGAYYADFIKLQGMARYSPASLFIDAANRMRFEQDMAVQGPAPLATSNGVTALVFAGCMAHACPEGVGVLAIDVATGELFVGVRDPQGEEVLKSNDRLQAVLEATSPSHSWADPVTWSGPIPIPPGANN